MIDLDSALTQANPFFGKKPLDVIDKRDVVADEKDLLDCRIVLLQQGCLVDKNQGLPASRWTDNDPVPPVILPGNGLLVMVQHPEPLDLMTEPVFRVPAGQFNPDNQGTSEI